MQKIDRIPAPAQRVRLGHWRSACQQQNPRTCVLRDREAGLLAQATSRQPAAGGSTELPGCGNTAEGIRRARRPGPIRRPLYCERATDPARSWPRGRERENYERKSKIRGLKRRRTDDSFHPSHRAERSRTDELGLAACVEAKPERVQRSFALPALILCIGVLC